MDGTRAQSPFFLQRAIMEEIRTLTSGMLFRVPGGVEMAPLHVFGQSLPIPRKKEETGTETIEYRDEENEETDVNFPWCVVKLEEGKAQVINERQETKVAVCFGIFDDSPENKGHEELLNLFQVVYERFAKDPLLDKQYLCSGSFNWALQDEDTYPYYFGAMLIEFSFQGFRRENKFL